MTEPTRLTTTGDYGYQVYGGRQAPRRGGGGTTFGGGVGATTDLHADGVPDLSAESGDEPGNHDEEASEERPGGYPELADGQPGMGSSMRHLSAGQFGGQGHEGEDPGMAAGPGAVDSI